MDSTSSLADYKEHFAHEPLDLGKNEIRVVRLVKKHTGFLECELKHCTTSDGHACLSYMWGEDEAKNPIKINGRLFNVRKNLFAFLKVAQKLEIHDWLWIDAICINQGNVKERNHQVQQMADIYRLAKHVYIFPGRLSSFSHRTAKVCTRLNLHKIVSANVPWSILPIAVPFRILAWPFIYQPHALPYWDRLWIVQELALASERYVVMPRKLLSWEEFESAFAEHNYAVPLPRVWRICHGWHRQGRQPLARLINTFAEAECQDERDRVFGLLGLTRSTIQVDYSTDKRALFCRVLENILLSQAYSMIDFNKFAKKLARALDVSGQCVCWLCFSGTGRDQERCPRDDEIPYNFEAVQPPRSDFNWSSSSSTSLSMFSNKASYILDMEHITMWSTGESLRLDSCIFCHDIWQLSSEVWALRQIFREKDGQRLLLIWQRVTSWLP